MSRLGGGAVGSSLVFLAVMLAYKAGLTAGIDHATTVLLGTIESTALDAIGQVDDDLARVIPTFTAAAAMSIVLAWKGPRWTWIVPLGIGLTGVVEFFAKLGFQRGLHLGEILNAARELIGFRYHTGATFPSGHVARTAFLAVVAVRLFPAWMSIPLVGFAALTFAARMYTEAHRLSDVFGGLALGLCAACIALWLSEVLASRA